MSDPYEHEPLIDHDAEEGEVVAVRHGSSAWGRLLGGLSLIGAVLLTGGAAVLLLTPTPRPNPAPAAATATATRATGEIVITVSPIAPTATPDPNALPVAALPTLAPADAAAILAEPVTNRVDALSPVVYVRDSYNPFTIIPDRPRNEVIQYEVQAGDTIFTIAERFGLKPESIAWSNDRGIIGGLRAGQNINIMPVDGAYYTVSTQQTIAEIASQLGVDPYTIIDTEYNDLFGAEPDTVLDVGTRVVVPGAIAETINWNARVERSGDASNSSSNGGSQIAFETGDPGSCGWTDNPGGSGAWTNPMGGGYTWVRGFTSWHTGVDLAAVPGTPVRAALGGTVIFAGWNSYGYGYTIVLAHGPYTTLYGHLSEIYVGCQQYVGAGQTIGGVGSTGDSSGPHLHFEIRSNDVATDPTYTMPF